MTARTTLYMQAGGGKRVPVEVSISAPRPYPESKYRDQRVFVRGPGIEGRLSVGGVDQVQALALAFVYLRKSIGRLNRRGVRFYLTPRGSEPVNLQGLWFGVQTRTSSNSRSNGRATSTARRQRSAPARRSPKR